MAQPEQVQKHCAENFLHRFVPEAPLRETYGRQRCLPARVPPAGVTRRNKWVPHVLCSDFEDFSLSTATFSTFLGKWIMPRVSQMFTYPLPQLSLLKQKDNTFSNSFAATLKDLNKEGIC